MSTPRLLLACAIAATLACAPAPDTAEDAAPDARPKADAFALIGDRYHNSDYIRSALNRTIVKQLGVTVDFTDDYTALTRETLDGYKMLIILRDGMIWPDGYPDERTNAGWFTSGKPELVSEPPLPEGDRQPAFWMQPEQGKAVREFLQGGGVALFLHNVTHVGLTDPDFRDALGAAYMGHPPIRPFTFHITNPDHPITQGVEDFIVTDEQHFMEYDKDPAYVFGETVNHDGLKHTHQGKDWGTTATGGFAFDYGEGRVCYLSPGHLLTVLWNPEYIKLQQNAVRWLLEETP